MREYLTEKEIDELVEKIMKLPRMEADIPVGTTHSIDANTVINALRDFKRVPTYDEVLAEYQKYKTIIDKLSQVIYEMDALRYGPNRSLSPYIDSLLYILRDVKGE
nr:MAG TPA: hypothetical protein [Caudoviricetes sp.]